jgi:hypothetical protein
MILFLDHIDWISKENETFVENFLKNLLEKSHKNTKMWFGTRNWYSDKIEDIILKFDTNFDSKYKLVPLYCQDRDNFTTKIVNSFSMTSSQVNSTIQNITENLKLLEIWRSSKKIIIDNIYLLKVIASHAANATLHNQKSSNFYQIMFEFIRKSEDFYNLAGNADRDLVSKSLALHILKNDVGFSDALENVSISLLIDRFASDNYNYRLPRSNSNIMTYSNRVILEKLNSGFLKIENDNLEFLNMIYLEYYVARYMADEFWMKITESTNFNSKSFKNKIYFFLNIYKDRMYRFPVIKRFFNDFVENIQKSSDRVTFDNNFPDVFKDIYVEFSNNTNIELREAMILLFRCRDGDQDCQDWSEKFHFLL